LIASARLRVATPEKAKAEKNFSGEASRGGGRGKVSFRSGCCTSASGNC